MYIARLGIACFGSRYDSTGGGLGGSGCFVGRIGGGLSICLGLWGYFVVLLFFLWVS